MGISLKKRFLKTNGVKLHTLLAGPEKGPLVILLHGFPEFWYGWENQISYLAREGYRVLVPDQRGYNLSDKPKSLKDYSRDVLAEDVVGLIKLMGRKRAIVIGHDWGGVVAWWMANKFPQHVEKLIIINSPHPKVMSRFLEKNWKQKLKSLYMLFFQLPALPEWLIRRGNFFLFKQILKRTSRPGTFNSEALDKYCQAWSQPDSLSAMLNWYRAAYRVRLTPPKDARIPMPVLLLWGKNDTFLSSELARPSISYCPKGKLIFLEKASHWAPHEEPQQINLLINEFLTQRSPSR